jgi:hypothetical protein
VGEKLWRVTVSLVRCRAALRTSRTRVAARDRIAAFVELLLPRTAKMNPMVPNLLILILLLILVGFYYLYRTHPEMFQPHHAKIVAYFDDGRHV